MKVEISGNLKVSIEDVILPPPSVPSLDGLVAHWTMDEKGRTVRRDSHTGKHDLFPSGMIFDSPGKIGGAAYYSGASTLSLVNYEPIWSGQPPFTAYLWAKMDGDLINGKQLLGHILPSGLLSGWSVRLQNTVERYAFRVSDGLGSLRDLDHPFRVVLGAWNFILVSLDENNVGTIRINGEQEISAQMVRPADPVGIPLRIGNDEIGAPRLVGAIDEVGIFNRLLSTEEKDALWSGKTYPYNQPIV